MSIKKSLPVLGALAIIVAALFWSLDGVFLRPHLYSLPPTVVVFWEHLLGFVALSPFLYYYRRELKVISKSQWAAVFWVALFGGALGTTFITKAFFLTNFQGLSVVILLQKLQPVFAIFLAIVLLKEKFPAKFYLWAVLALAGGYFTTFPDGLPNFATGDKTVVAATFALLAAFAWGSSTTFGKYAIRTIHYGLLGALRFGGTVVIMAIALLLTKTFALPSAPQWGYFLIIVATSGAGAMFLYYYGLKKVAASQATLYELAWPVSAVILDYVLNGTILTATQTVGAVILIAAVARITRLKSQPVIITGTVVKGGRLGGKLGLPTANLDIALAKGLTSGVYHVTVTVADHNYHGLLHYGYNWLQSRLSLEVLINDFTGDIYGATITVTVGEKIREIKKFKSFDQAIKVIKQDIRSG